MNQIMFAACIWKEYSHHRRTSVSRDRFKHSHYFLNFFCTLEVIPDVCVYPIVNGKEIPVPALLVEVHSSPFRDSVRKCILGVIEQLCLYRTANPDVSSCIGFTFPKLPSAGTGNLQSVVQVTVTWASFQF